MTTLTEIEEKKQNKEDVPNKEPSEAENGAQKPKHLTKMQAILSKLKKIQKPENEGLNSSSSDTL